MKRSSTAAFIFSMFLLLFWSCNKESKAPAPTPGLPATPYSYSADSKDKILLASKINIITTGKIGLSTFSWSSMPVWPSATVSNSGVSLGRVIFFDNGTSNTLHINCQYCHSGGPVVNPAEYVSKTVEDQKSLITQHSAIQNQDALIAMMKGKVFYAQLFKDAYGTPDITAERISDALAQYMAAMASVGSAPALASDVRFADPFK